jgi:tetratricopeptide (TPR) repeat protein/tRNA A-37 threonylcarbamoyl transferase component Bud32
MNKTPSPEHWARIRDRFHQILEAPMSARGELLARLEAEDAELAGEVRSLLEAEAHGPLGAKRDGLSGDLVAEYVGPYRLIRRIGEGGMGTVYLAERDQAGFSQRVALKLLRSGFLDRRLAEHVAHERRVLARLEHPNIARLIDGGSTPSGQPYFAMEYVEGRTLLAHSAAVGLSLEARIELFAEVCDAVHYAHQQLVVHRDLKPSNVMVGSDGRPRLLDFGVAKLLDPDETRTSLTRSTPWVTVAYASPEQFQGGSVSTLSDGYALGVILYELLAGVRPYDLDGRTPAEMERLICDLEPPPPSERCPDPKVARALQGDLDTIVLKALAKAPARRYPSAEQLAGDLRRFVSGRPVLARSDTLRYRMGKLVRRHRTAAAVAAVAAVLVLAGVVAVQRQAAVARRERDRAEGARLQAEQIADYVIGLFEAANFEQSSMDTTAARTLLQQGVERAEALTGQPLVQANMFDALGMVFLRLQRFDQASALLGRAWQLRTERLPPEHPDLAESQAHMGRVFRAQSKYPEALASYERALAIRLAAFGNGHAKVAESYRDLGFLMPYLGRNEESVEYYRQALAIDRKALGEDHPQTADDVGLVGLALRRTGPPAEAVALLEEALASKIRVLGPDDPASVVARFHLADQLRLVGRGAEAEQLYREGIARQRKARGDRDSGLIHGMANLASFLGERGRGPEAEALLREVVSIQRARYGTGAVPYAAAVNELGNELARQGRHREGIALQREGLAIWKAVFGTDHTAVAAALGHLSESHQRLGELTEAERFAREALAIRVRLFGPDQTLTGLAYLRLAEVLTAQRRLVAAESAGARGLAIIEATRPPNHTDAQLAHAVLARLNEALGRPAEAERHRKAILP